MPPPEIDPSDLKNPALYINRELSWLEFNERVLAQALDPTHPLLERVKFLSIVATNLDEFFMIRVSTTQKKLREGIEDVAPDGYNTQQQLEAMRVRALRMLQDQAACWNELRTLLEGENIWFLEAGPVDPRGARVPRRAFLERDLPGADAAGVRPGPPVPAHFEPQQELRGGRPPRRPDEVRAREGAGRAPAVRGGARSR